MHTSKYFSRIWDNIVKRKVLNNIVEAFNKTMSKIVGRKRLRINAFATRIQQAPYYSPGLDCGAYHQVINTIKRSSPQHFVKRPAVINETRGYDHDNKVRGMKLHERGHVREVGCGTFFGREHALSASHSVTWFW